MDAQLAAPVSDFLGAFIGRALRERLRYRYVHPVVRREGEGFRIESPCCSRNVDRAGGVIDIALLRPAAGRWQLCWRDHAAGAWVLHARALPLADALEAVCIDKERKFWP